MLEPYTKYAILVEITEGDDSQRYRVEWQYGESEYRHGIDDEGDPRRAMGKALEELGRSLQLGHGHPLVSP